jgi:hypothetical protein
MDHAAAPIPAPHHMVEKSGMTALPIRAMPCLFGG